MYKMNTKEISAFKILNTIEIKIDILKKEYDTIEDDFRLVCERLEKTQSLVPDDLTVDEFDNELSNFCKYSINESVKSDNVYIIDKFHEFVYIVDNMK